MKEPILLFRPQFMRDRRNTPLSLWEGSPVSIIQGQYGLAWQMSEAASVIDFEYYNLETPFTIMIRTRMETDTAGEGFNLSPNWSLPSWANHNFKPQVGESWGYLGDETKWADIRTNITTPAGTWVTIAVVVTEDAVKMYQDGDEIDILINLAGSDNYAIEGNTRQLVLGANLALESYLIFDSALTDNEVRYVSRLRETWTWDNVQMKEASTLVKQAALEPQSKQPQARSYQLIPRLYKANRHNVLGEDISEYVTRGTIEYNPDRTIKFDFKLTLNNSRVVRAYNDFLAPFLTVRYDDGHEVTSQMGLYGIIPPNGTINEHGASFDVEGRDLTWLLSLDVFDNGYSVAAGTNVVTAVRTILNNAGFTRISIQESSRTITSTRSWKAGTTKLQVINDLLTGAGYYSLTCDKDGTFVSVPYVSIVNPTVVVEYDTTKPSYVGVVRHINKGTTQDRIANKIVVVKDNANEAPIVATAINTNPLSPTSIQNIGMTIAKVVTNTDVTDQATAKTIAMKHLEEASEQYNKVTIFTTPDVERGINEVYRLNIVNAAGDVVVSGNWHCRGWKLGFTPQDGMMQHDLSNIVNPPMEV